MTYSRKIVLLFGLVLFTWTIVVPYACSAPYTSPPDSLRDINWKWQGNILAVIWKQSDNTYFCMAGDWTNAVAYFNSLPELNDTESFYDYAIRARPQIASRDLTPEEIAVCNILLAANRPVWVVKQYRTNPDRPVKRIITVDNQEQVDTSDTIGRIVYGAPCGNEIFSGTSTMWREVTITYPDGAQVRGASVCQKE